MLDTASKKTLTDLGFDVDKLTAAISATDEQAYAFVPKTGEITIGGAKLHIYDDEGHNGLKGRVKTETLTQATELGVKSVAKQFGVDYTGNDPAKLQEAVIAKLNIPIDDKVKEKDRDIATMTKNWNDEKAAREQAEAKWKDREEFDRDVTYFPENRIKTVKDKTLRMELMEDGIKIGDFEGKPAVYVNGEVQKNADITLVDPKTFISEHFKTKGWMQPEATTTPPKRTFDTKGKPIDTAAPKFNHDTTYAQLIEKYGSFNDKARAEYTQAMLDVNKA